MTLLDSIETLYKVRKRLSEMHKDDPFEKALIDKAIENVDDAIQELRVQLTRQAQK